MNDPMTAWTDADVLRAFFWLFEWGFARPIHRGSRDRIVEMMRAELSRDDPTVGELVRYIVDQTTVILTTPSRKRDALAGQAREIAAGLFADTSDNGRGRILRALAQAVHPAPGAAPELAAPQPPYAAAPPIVVSAAAPPPIQPVAAPPPAAPPQAGPHVPANASLPPSLSDDLLVQEANRQREQLNRDIRFRIEMADLERARNVINSIR